MDNYSIFLVTVLVLSVALFISFVIRNNINEKRKEEELKPYSHFIGMRGNYNLKTGVFIPETPTTDELFNDIKGFSLIVFFDSRIESLSSFESPCQIEGFNTDENGELYAFIKLIEGEEFVFKTSYINDAIAILTNDKYGSIYEEAKNYTLGQDVCFFLEVEKCEDDYYLDIVRLTKKHCL